MAFVLNNPVVFCVCRHAICAHQTDRWDVGIAGGEIVSRKDPVGLADRHCRGGDPLVLIHQVGEPGVVVAAQWARMGVGAAATRTHPCVYTLGVEDMSANEDLGRAVDRAAGEGRWATIRLFCPLTDFGGLNQRVEADGAWGLRPRTRRSSFECSAFQESLAAMLQSPQLGFKVGATGLATIGDLHYVAHEPHQKDEEGPVDRGQGILPEGGCRRGLRNRIFNHLTHCIFDSSGIITCAKLILQRGQDGLGVGRLQNALGASAGLDVTAAVLDRKRHKNAVVARFVANPKTVEDAFSKRLHLIRCGAIKVEVDTISKRDGSFDMSMPPRTLGIDAINNDHAELEAVPVACPSVSRVGSLGDCLEGLLDPRRRISRQDAVWIAQSARAVDDTRFNHRCRCQRRTGT
mmetsp:Transcript_7990/g.20484  ORF Transcript_7990/g.20484 Transcript_7990/m.20484 type:complete len:405 (+) Transcript_7990:374-1588(+)